MTEGCRIEELFKALRQSVHLLYAVQLEHGHTDKKARKSHHLPNTNVIARVLKNPFLSIEISFSFRNGANQSASP